MRRDRNNSIRTHSCLRPLVGFVIICAVLLLTACAQAPHNMPAIHAYYQYEFTAAREALRGDAMTRNDEQTILNQARLGIAALADGDLHEAELAFEHVFNLLSTAGLNEDRTIAAVMSHEGVRIWKGEPFEQALMYHYIASLYAVMGDWENARAAAANSIFRLTDFGEYRTSEQLARRAARDPDFLDEGYTAVDTNFALGFLMQAIASQIAGAPGMDEQLEAAVQINAHLDSLADVIRRGEYDTLLIVHYGKGPTKIAYGPNNALAGFEVQEWHQGPLIVKRGGQTVAQRDPVANVNQMARDHRWNNLEDVRRAKSLIGDLLVTGGIMTTAVGADRGSGRTALAGLGLIAAGLLTQSGAQADTRYLEFLPQTVYLVPLRLGEVTDLDLQVVGDAGSRLVLPNFEPGSTRNPRAVYLRLHGRGSPNPRWMTASAQIYGNDHREVRGANYPWILGGRDVSTPSRATLQAYQEAGYLRNFTVTDLFEIYEREEIHIGAGMEDRPGYLRNPSFRHILEGGTGLFTPEPDSMGYKRLMYTPRSDYQPRSERVRNLAGQIGVHDDE